MLTNGITPDKIGGLYRYVRELADALVEKGCEVAILTKSNPDVARCRQTVEHGVTIVRHDVPRKSNPLFFLLYPLYVAFHSWKFLRQHPDALVHVHFPTLAVAPILLRREFVYTFHSPVHKELLGERQGSYMLPGLLQTLAVRSLKLLERAALSRAQRVIVLSRYSADEVDLLVRRNLGSSIEVVPGGVSTREFKPQSAKRENEPNSVFGGAWPALLVARRLVWRMGVRELIHAFQAVKAVYPNAHLAVLGDGPLRQDLERLAASLGVQSSVSFLGNVSTGLVDWYNRADLVVMPAQSLEGFGLSSAEAFACGTPVVATRVGANPEVVGGVSPLLLADGISVRDIEAAILRVLQSEDLQALGAQAHKVATSLWSWPKVAERHEEVYLGIAGSIE